MRTIKSWVSHCDKKHAQCQINAVGRSLENSPPYLPSRVIDVGLNDSLDSPYLMIPGQNQRGFYTILSHCWGEVRQLCTSDHNMSQHRQQLPWDLLCKTYQDAITVTKSLNIRYLWIDSLCIVQDSSEDWKYESARMAQYYGDAYCTIAADAAVDGSKGLFVQEHEFLRARLPVQTFMCHHDHTTMLTNKQRPSIVLARNPMHRRAWCVQERLLSRRTLQFSTDQVYFECKRCLKAEDGRYYGRGSMSHSFYEVVDLK
ncbi:HET-domain-containing protein [Macroventuria anomochaeta]|uniref:HET-domain-containing protein n=1 Tax=Macroventuria anomochaeta TaxID=301207 RepID=A0ACB6RKN3_9PLEO|nr:HET-domain-containing protein [Macroventuria anomochaeta]KAF2621653.1 HET-domain-containing protein [Macroventuria anomochaeta]